MTVRVSQKAEEELDAMPEQLRILFLKHFRKIQSMPPRRHMRYGIPHHVEEVTKQARFIYNTFNDDICVIHCFKSHKEYERWYKSYR